MPITPQRWQTGSSASTAGVAPGSFPHNRKRVSASSLHVLVCQFFDRVTKPPARLWIYAFVRIVSEHRSTGEGVFTLRDTWSFFFGLTSKILPLGSMLNFDADFKKTTARHQCENPLTKPHRCCAWHLRQFVLASHQGESSSSQFHTRFVGTVARRPSPAKPQTVQVNRIEFQWSLVGRSHMRSTWPDLRLGAHHHRRRSSTRLSREKNMNKRT